MEKSSPGHQVREMVRTDSLTVEEFSLAFGYVQMDAMVDRGRGWLRKHSLQEPQWFCGFGTW